MSNDSTSYTYQAHSVHDTEQLAHHVAAWSHAGMVISLDGDLGAGKTTFAQAFAKAMGVRELVNSPTFTIIKEYSSGTLPLYHMDVYRITADDADQLGLDEYLYGEGVCVVEWAQRISDLLPAARLEIAITNGEGQSRCFHMTDISNAYKVHLDRLKESGVVQ